MAALLRAIVAAAVLATVPACGDAATDWVTLHAADAGRTISLDRADYLEVLLPGNISTGYSWEVVAFDDGVLRQLDGPSYDSEGGAPGAGGTFAFEFQCAGAGTTNLELGYLRPWEDAPPIDTWSVTVVVPG